jgi:DNA-binding GntR family transcriptional regulator
MIMDEVPRQRGAPYRRIAATLREEIKPKTAGEQVSSASQISERFGVSRNTAVRALGVLKAEGWIDTEPGWGSFRSNKPA